MYEEERPEEPKVFPLEAALVGRIWSDFGPYFAQEAEGQPLPAAEAAQETTAPSPPR